MCTVKFCVSIRVNVFPKQKMQRYISLEIHLSHYKIQSYIVALFKLKVNL